MEETARGVAETPRKDGGRARLALEHENAQRSTLNDDGDEKALVGV